MNLSKTKLIVGGERIKLLQQSVIQRNLYGNGHVQFVVKQWVQTPYSALIVNNGFIRDVVV